MLSIFLPVGSNVQISAGLQACRKRADKVSLQQAAFVMTLLRPRVGKKHVYAMEAGWGHHIAHNLNCIVLDDADVFQMLLVNLLEKASHAWRMYIDSQEVRSRVQCGYLRRCLAHAEADFQDRGRGAPKYGFEVEQIGRVRNAECRHQCISRTLLCARNASLTKDVAADGALGDGHRARMIASEQRLTKAHVVVRSRRLPGGEKTHGKVSCRPVNG